MNDASTQESVKWNIEGRGWDHKISTRAHTYIHTRIDRYFSLLRRHNDLPWNIRKFLKNQLREFRFDDLRDTHPWSRSAWSHTDLRRLKEGMVAAQVSLIITVITRVRPKLLLGRSSSGSIAELIERAPKFFIRYRARNLAAINRI